MPTGKTAAEHIIDLCREILHDQTEIKQQLNEIMKRLGEDTMEPLDKRLKRMETKLTAIGNGEWKEVILDKRMEGNRQMDSGWNQRVG